MDDEIREYYESVKDSITEEQFEERMNYFREKYDGLKFYMESDFAKMVVEECKPDDEKKVDTEATSDDYDVTKIADLKVADKGDQSTSISGRVMSISNPKIFKTKQGKQGKLANVEIADNTGSIRATFWTENIKLLKNFKEGDIIQINNVSIRKGYYGDNEATLRQLSTVNNITEKVDESDFPEYDEVITKIADIGPDETVNIIARITRIPSIRTFEKEDRTGKVTSLELMDESGEISYTLWNNDVDLIKTLGLEDGDVVKILGASSREGREGEISLNHRGRIIKDEESIYDVPEFSNPITKIADVKEQDNVNICGVITKVQDIKTFKRNDGTDGKLRSFEVADDSGAIRVTVWGADADEPRHKGDIVKIVGGSARFDDYTDSGYSLNTNWNTQITTPSNISEEDEFVFDEIRQKLHPITIDLLTDMDDDGIEVDVMGRIISSSDINEFQRDDGSVGVVRSVELSDGTGIVTLSLWGEKADYDFKTGDAFKFENARTKLGMYAVDLNVGSTSRIIKLSEEEAGVLPAFDSIEKMIFDLKSIDEIDEDDENICVVARIIDISPIREFNRDDGGSGLLRRIEIADDSGVINFVLWNDNVNIEYGLGDAIKIMNPRIRFNDNDMRLELQTGRNTSIMDPSESEMSTLSSYEELQDLIYEEKELSELTDDDINVKIKGRITDPSNNRILLTKCPYCNASINEFGEDEFICPECTAEIEKPKHLLMIPARLEDDDGVGFQITFFDKLAEELLDMDTEEIVTKMHESDDPGMLEGKIDDLDGLNIEIIADVDFDEYNEETRLKPKKILSKEL